MRKFLIITTINKPNKTIDKYIEILDNQWKIIIVGDRKGPIGYDNYNEKIIFLDIETQYKLYPDLSSILPENHYCRKNIGYIHAIKLGADFIAETDDDNTPYDFYPTFIEDNNINIDTIIDKGPINIYKKFTDINVWPRGFPLTEIKKDINKIEIKNIKPLIQQGLANLDPDVDAIYRLTNYEQIEFKPNKNIALSEGTFCPINTQNTFWHKDSFPLLLIPSSVHSRICDIWKGYIAQRGLWTIGGSILFSSPSVFQERNEHNLQNDFNAEIPLYTDSSRIINELDNLKLEKDNINDNLLTIYNHLYKKGFLLKSDIELVTLWIKYLNNI